MPNLPSPQGNRFFASGPAARLGACRHDAEHCVLRHGRLDLPQVCQRSHRGGVATAWGYLMVIDPVVEGQSHVSVTGSEVLNLSTVGVAVAEAGFERVGLVS